MLYYNYNICPFFTSFLIMSYSVIAQKLLPSVNDEEMMELIRTKKKHHDILKHLI